MNRIMKSEKGQSLILFVVFVPLVVMLGTYVVDVSNARYESNKINNINKIVIEYGLNHIDDDPKEDMIKLIYQNDEEIDNYMIELDTTNKTIIVELEKSSPGLFGSIVGKDLYQEKSKYKGYFIEDKMIIERVDK